MDRRGVPLAVWLTAANVHASVIVEALIEAVEPVTRPGRRGRASTRPAQLHADRAYDLPRCRVSLRRRGTAGRTARKGAESPEPLGRHRGVVERTPAWLARSRRLAICSERDADLPLACLDLARALICLRLLHQHRFSKTL